MSEESAYPEEDAGQLVGEIFSGKLGIDEALTKLRTRLLDLTMRNRLLNFRPSRTRNLQFTNDPDLDQLYERLEEGKVIPLSHVPDPPHSRYENGKKPDARVYARECSIGTSVDLGKPTQGRRHHELQVIAYPSELERIAKKISTEARTVVEETGTNMLYLVFGFLEYYDSDDSEQAVLAPVLSMPVTLTKGDLDQDSRTYRYNVAYSGDDVAENFTLREKLRQQFRLELPALAEDESPESYLQKIKAAVSRNRRWTVRRQLTLAFLSFGKLAIWADLDPERSPALLKSSLLADIFKGGSAGDGGGFHAEDYSIDAHQRAELPLIYDADSSQHSALIDVLDGKSLVINGPPGTGKSQTITNIVATAMAEGKKILFVSEKMAALSVVKQRLENVGLGDFCLELHSNKTQKKQLLENIERRIGKRFSSPSGYERQLEVLRERRSALNAYAQLLGSKVANNLDMTVHEVFWATERRRKDLDAGVQEFAALVFEGVADWTPDVLDRWRQIFGAIQGAIHDMGTPPDRCAWSGFSPKLLLPGDEEPILRTVRDALESARELVEHTHDFEQALGLSELTSKQVLDAASERALLETVPPQMDEHLLKQLCSADVLQVDAAVRCVNAVRMALHDANQWRVSAASVLVDLSRPDAKALQDYDAQRAAVFSESGRGLSLRELQHKSNVLSQLLLDLGEQLPADAFVPQKSLELATRLRGQLANPGLAFASEISCTQLTEQAKDALARVRQQDEALTQLDGVLRKSGLNFGGSVGELRKILDGTSFPELQPQAAVDGGVVDALHLFALQGFGDWTAERFDAVLRDGLETFKGAKDAAEELIAFFGRLNLPVEQSASWLQSLEILITVCEQAPAELLGLRGPGLERADFVEIAKRAEERHNSIAAQERRVSSAFHLDTLPPDAQLREHLAVARRGDSFFNFMRSDWRRAKAAFRGCYRGKEKFSAQVMAENFAAVASWREAAAAYEADAQISGTLGALFEGRKTDYGRVRRLSSWLTSANQALTASDFAFAVKALTLPQEQIAVIKAADGKLRQAAARVKAFGKLIGQLTGFDQAAAIGRKWDLAYGPVERYFEHLKDASQKLRQVVRASVSVNRAIGLAQLRMSLQTHRPLIEDLIASPRLFADLAGTLGLPSQTLAYEHLPTGIETIAMRAEMVETLADCVRQVGGHLTPKQALAVLDGVQRVDAEASWLRSRAGGFLLREYFEYVAQDHHAAKLVLNFLAGKVNHAETLDAGMAALVQLNESESILDAVGGREDVTALLGNYYRRLETPINELMVCSEWAQSVQRASGKLPPGATSSLLGAGAVECARRAARALLKVSHAYQSYEEQINSLLSFGALDWTAWGGTPRPQDAVERLTVALAGAGQLVPWSKYLSSKEDCVECGLEKVLVPFEAGVLPTPLVVTAFEYVFFRSIARTILSRHRELGRFTGASHDALRREFADLDKELIRLNGLLHAAKIDHAKKVPTGIASGRAADLTEMSLLTREISKQKRHIPIRQLLKRAGKTLQQLKPCFMMGPLSVAQYLEQGHLQFDLVVMDEASQLRPEDALGALARGKQLVVVGDPKQLPPTNFFDRLMEDEEEGESTSAVVEGVESILGVCEHLYRPVRTLRWHYRSQHESLIAFSNSQFYDGRLVVFPAPVKRNSSLGVNHRFVKDGVYADRRNHPEAERVVDAVLEHMKLRPQESLGVVTLNQTQRELIDDIFERRSKGNQYVAEFLDFHKKAGWEFFVKNLENVQGDERDVIYISTTFGRPPGAKVVRKNFGPINRPDGWRRLNVLFTRARRRLDLFTSLRPSDVMSPDERVSLGRKALHDYLVFAKTGLLPAVAGQRTGRDPDSDFEIAVARALEQAGFEVEPQVGVAGYFIDIGVKHASRPGEYLAAVECDGATYHSSLSARDRDRIRQQILESLGWKGRIIRVWSTDWFADPNGQIKRLTDFLHARLAETSPLAYVEEAAPEDSEDDGDPSTQADYQVDVKPVEVLESTSGKAAEAELLVEVGDLVTYVVDTPSGEEQLTIQIVDTASNPRLNLVNESSPLAQVLIGLCSGDESELAVQGHAPRKVRVVSIKRPGLGAAVNQSLQPATR